MDYCQSDLPASFGFEADKCFELLERLFMGHHAVSGQNSLDTISIFTKELDFKVHKVPTGTSLRGWTIPKGWHPSSAKLYHFGNMIYDCLQPSSLGVAYLSPSYSGYVSKEQLFAHCSYRQDLPDAIVYDWSRIYRSSIDSWGLSIPFNILSNLPDDDLYVDIQTSTYDSYMPIFDFLVKGKSAQEVVVTAHNCHPYQANDDLSGCAVAILLGRWLSSRPSTNKSYRILIGPELFAPMHWLQIVDHSNILAVLQLKSIGNNSDLHLQTSFRGTSSIDKACLQSAKDLGIDLHQHPFRTYYGNDETVFEAPGYRIPTATLTRFPFPEYHTHLDNLEHICPDALSQTATISSRILHMIDSNCRASYVAPGLYCLSNPLYNLYQPAPEPGLSQRGTTTDEKIWNLLMNCLPMHLDDGLDILQIADMYSLPFDVVLAYVRNWSRKGLVALSCAP